MKTRISHAPIALAAPAVEYRLLKPELDGALARVLDSGDYVADSEISALERELAAYCGVAHAVGTASGTMALVVALRTLGISSGDEVIVPTYTCISTAAAVSLAGARVCFADVSEETLTLDPAAATTALTERTRAMIAVHLHGQVAAVEQLAALCRQNGLYLIEDAALSLGATFHGRPAGSLGDASTLSFAPSKILGAMGWGGMVLTNNRATAIRARQIAGFGSAGGEPGADDELEGYNAQLDELQAAMLRVKLRYVPAWLEQRRRTARRYDRACDRLAIRRLQPPTGTEPAPRSYVIRVREREHALAVLAAHGVAAHAHFLPLLHLRPVYRHLGYGVGSFPMAERVAEELLCLPLHPHLTEAEVETVIETLETIAERERAYVDH